MESWLKVPPQMAKDASSIAERCAARAEAKIVSGEYTRDEAAYVAKLDLRPVKGELHLSDSELEKLRRLCQVWDIDFRIQNITSHRKIIGPFIVGAKKLLLPILRALLRNLIEQQKEFNASAISLLAEISNRKR